MFQHLLLPVDFTDKNRVALEMAAQLARQNNSRITLLHVVETIEKLDDADIEKFYGMLKRRSNTKLAELANAINSDIEVEQITLLGKPATEIVRCAIDRDIDLLIMNSHAVQPEGSKGWGTLSYRVSILCQCPVLLVK